MIDDPLIMGILIASWMFALGTLVTVLRWLFRRRRMQKAAVAALHRDENGVMVVPVLATFTGVSGLPVLVAVASNSLNPRLVIQPGAIDYRVTAARSVAMDDIASVRIQTAPATVNLVFTFASGPFTLAANVGDVAVAQAVLAAYPALAAKQVLTA